MAQFTLSSVCDLAEGVRQVRMDRLFAQNDKLAHTISVNVMENGSAASLTGLSASGYFIRADDAYITISGTITGNNVTVTLPASCYTVPGHFSLIIKVHDQTHAVPVFWGDGTITRTVTDRQVS